MRDPQQRAHAELAHAVLIQDFAFQTEVRRHLTRTFGQTSRCQQVGRLVGEIAGEVLRLRENPAAIHRRLRAAQHGKRRYLLLVFLRISLVTMRLHIAEQCSLHGRGGEIV